MSGTDPRTPIDGAPINDDDAASRPVTWHETWIAADSEAERAESSRRTTLSMIVDAQSERDRAMGRRIADDQARRAVVFGKIRWVLDKIATDPELRARVHEIAAEEKRARNDAADEAASVTK